MEVYIAIVVSSVVGCLVTLYWQRTKFVGTLRIDSSEPDEPPRMFLELNKGVGDISRLKRVSLDVSTKNYISHD